MVDTENRLKLGCFLSPASLTVSPWTRTWSMTVARISSDSSTLCLPLRPLPCPPPPFLPSSSSSPSSHTHSSSHIVSSIHSQTFSIPPSTTCLLSELAYMGCHIIWNRLNQFWVVVFNQWHVFSICIWLLPLVFTSMDDVQNVFWEWECV